MSPETAPVSPEALRLAREQRRLSQRELGRRVAKRLGQGQDGARALQVRLSRIERGDAISETDREVLEALAAELAVGVGDLAEPPVWVWIRVAGGVPGIVELAMRFPVYTSPEAAYQARDFLAHASDGHFTPFADAHLVPMRPGTLMQDVLDENYPDLDDHDRRLLVSIDPDERTLPYLAGLNEVLNSEQPETWSMDAIVDTIIKFGLVGEIIQLHELALRRLTQAPPDNPAIVTAWCRREYRLNELLEAHALVRREQRMKTLAGIAGIDPQAP